MFVKNLCEARIKRLKEGISDFDNTSPGVSISRYADSRTINRSGYDHIPRNRSGYDHIPEIGQAMIISLEIGQAMITSP